ncbi:MAG: DUF5671 domain-containing protein [Candidatus Doudnabacteria bacterium]
MAQLITAPRSTPKDVFMHLLAIVTLYASVVSFIALLWQFINIWFPDPLNYYYTSILNSIRWSASVLVVMYPVYVLMTWLINREFGSDPALREIRVRKWLVYLTLFISALTVIIDVITLVYNLFGGEVTLRFFLKILVVLITAAAVFLYYYYDLRLGSIKNIKVLAWGVSLLVLASAIGGFIAVGSPARQRQLNFDSRKVSDLQTIQGQVVNYWQQKDSLPPTLNDLKDSISGFSSPVDPETNNPYEYAITGNLAFQLCANFNLPSLDQGKAIPMIYPYDNWNHDYGRVCFERTIDPQLYNKSSPPLPRPQPLQ